MPIVPMPQRQIGTAPLPDARLSPNAPAAAFPGAVNTGIDVSGVRDVVERVQQQEQQRADQVRVASGLSTLMQAKNDAVGKLWQSRGTNAMGVADTVQSDFKKQVATIMQQLTPNQQVAFQQHALAEGLDLQVTVQRHLAGEMQRVTDQSYKALDAGFATDALRHASEGDLGGVDADIDKRTAALRQYAQQIGMPDVARDEAIARAKSQTRYSVFEQMSNAGQDLAASAYLNKYRGDFVGNDLMRAEKIDDLGSVRGASQRQADQITSGGPPGLITSGNIDLTKRPRVQNSDGSVSTVRSMSFERDGKEILIPTVSDDGKLLSDAEAIAQYDRTGKHLGIFSSADAADAYAQQLHDAQAAMLQGRGNGEPPKAAVTLSAALAQVAQISDPRVRDATEQRVRRHFEDKAADERQERADAWTRASAILEKTKDASQIPLETRMKLTPEENDALDHREDVLRHPKAQTNLSVYAHLTNLSSLNDATRAQFNTMDLSPYRSQLSDEDYKHFLNLQRAARNGEDRQADAATRRVQQREEGEVFKSAAAAQKSTTGNDLLRQRMKAQGKSDSDIEKVMANVPQPKGPRVVVPQWMVDSAAHDPEYAEHLRAHGVPIPEPKAATAGASAAQPIPPALNPYVNPFNTQTPPPAPQRPPVPGAPMPNRRAVPTGPAGLNLAPAGPPARPRGASRTF